MRPKSNSDIADVHHAPCPMEREPLQDNFASRTQVRGEHLAIRETQMFLLTGKVAIVTGASSGIGQGIAKRLGCEGAKVIVDYIGDSEGAEETRKAIKESGGEGEIVHADVTSMNDVHWLVNTAWDRFGVANILVNNAGMEKKSDFWDTTERITTGDGGQPAWPILSDAGICEAVARRPEAGTYYQYQFRS